MPQSETSEAVVCPECQATFEVEPATSASSFPCPQCGISSSLGALRNPDLRPEALAIAGATGEASTENVYRYTVAYVYPTSDGGVDGASGTVIQIGPRLLLATVGHAVPKSIKSVALVKKAGLLTPESLTYVTRRMVSSSADVAVFELEPNAITRAGLEAIGLERIHDGQTGSPNFKARLIGFPKSWIVAKNPLPGLKRFHGLGYGCEPIEPSRWPAIGVAEDTFDEGRDIVVEYSHDTIDFGRKLDVPPGVPDPFGMSGGGIWQRTVAVPADEIWTAEGLCLFGIQSSWLDKKGYLKAVQIIHWLKLVADEYPELRAELQERFPRLKQMTE
jgi:hypothetical protein